MKKVVLFVFVLSVFWGFSQNVNYKALDDLKEEIKKAPAKQDLLKNIDHTTPKYHFLEGYRQKCLGKYDNAKASFIKASQLCKRKDLFLSPIYHELSIVCHYQCSKDSAILMAKKAVEIESFNDTIFKTGYALGNIAVFFKSAQEIDSALKYNKLAINIYEQTSDSLGIAKIENNLGNLYKEIDSKHAIKHFNKAYRIYKRLGKTSHKAYVEHNLGLLYLKAEEYESALEFLRSANKYTPGDRYFHAINDGNIGLIYLRLKNYTEAEKYLKKAIKINEEENYSKVHAFLNLGELYILQKKYSKAEEYLNESLRVSQKIEYQDIRKSIYESLSYLYALTNRSEEFKVAFQNYESSIDSFFVNKYRDKLAEYDKKLEVEKTKKELELSQKNKLIKEQEILRQKSKIKTKDTLLILEVIISVLLMLLLISVSIIAKKRNALAKAMKQQKENLVIQNEKLEAAVRERTKELEKATEKAKESDLLKSTFLANLSHQIRTPLNSIMGFSDLLSEQNFSGDNLTQYSSIIRNNGFTLLNIITDLIDVSKIESNMFDINLSPTICEDVIESVKAENIDKAKFFGKQDSVELKWNFSDTPCNFLSDLSRIVLVFDKLINNAFQYTEKGFIEVGSVVNKETVTFYIQDTGIGIDEEFINQVFENFRKIDKQNTINRGLGVGLFVSKYIIENMNSQLEIESEKGKGTKLWFTCKLI